ncbi:MAG TPA: radical SAM protein [Dehalococcoidia bacterium]
MPHSDLTRPPPPRSLQVEVTGSCNLRCRMCLVRYRPALGRSASMPFQTFRRLLEELPEVRDVTLQGLGEPLLAPDLFRMVAYCRERGITVGFNTNATLLTPANGARLIEAGLDWLHVSVDGASPETYQFVRDGARWETVERNVTGFVRLLRERRAVRPEVSLVMVLMRRNLRELPAVVERAARWGIPRVFVQGLSHDFSDAPDEAYAAIARYAAEQTVAGLPREEVETVLEQARDVAAWEGVHLRLPALAPRPARAEVDGTPVGCDWPWRAAYVGYDGTVQPCCMVMGSDRAAMGNVHAVSFREVWEGEAFRRFREGLVTGRPHPVCRGCAAYRGTF